MTLYIVKWQEKDSSNKHTHACSSYVKAQSILKKLNENPNAVLLPNLDGDIISKHKLTGQDQVIDLINSL